MSAGTLASLLVEHVVSVTVDFEMISLGGRIVGNFYATRHVCVVIHADIGKLLTGMARSGILNELELRYFDQHVNEMMTTAGKKFQNF